MRKICGAMFLWAIPAMPRWPSGIARSLSAPRTRVQLQVLAVSGIVKSLLFESVKRTELGSQHQMQNLFDSKEIFRMWPGVLYIILCKILHLCEIGRPTLKLVSCDNVSVLPASVKRTSMKAIRFNYRTLLRVKKTG